MNIPSILKRIFFPYILIFLAGILLYFKTLSFDLTYLDDHIWVNDYHWFLKDFKNLPLFFLQPDFISGVFYRPFLNISFMINSAIGGTSPFVYHLTNILIHILNGCLLFNFLKQLRYNAKAAGIFCVLFVVHPVLVSSVAWIPGRTDSLLAFFVLLSLICLNKYVEKERTLFLFMHGLFLLGALLVKETAVATPLVAGYGLLLYATKRRWKILVPVWVGIIGLWLLVRQYVLRDAQMADFETIIQSLWTNAPSLISYFGKVFLPLNLSVLPVLEDLPLIYGLVSLGVLLICIFAFGVRQWSRLIFGLVWFLLFLIPALVISFLKHEYRLYLPMIGCFFMLYEMKVWYKAAQRPFYWIPGVTAILTAFFILSLQHMDHFRERMAFWQNAVVSSPHSPLAHRNLGAMYYLEKDLDKAEEEYHKALELSPLEPMVHNNLGLIYADRQQPQLALQEYLAEIAVNPDYDNVYFNLGNLYYSQGYIEEAVSSWKTTISLNDRYVQAYWNLMLHYLSRGDRTNTGVYIVELQKRGVEIPANIQQVWQRLNPS
ncbi:MAG: tetratricopeptide repeat protein [Candidatus Omnitrophica bacterium]|nr:tetratricopeptide repeat protein [Candidatus Omnitrophota bacterium]